MRRIAVHVGILALGACAPDSVDLTDVLVRGDRASACNEGPGNLGELPLVPVTPFYVGELVVDEPPDAASVVIETSIQREWSLLRWDWGPQGADFGSLDADPRNAGHGVFLAASRDATCGLQVLEVGAWQVDEEEPYATYVEMTVRDEGGDCRRSEWVGAAVGVPIADFPFHGPLVGCVHVVDADEPGSPRR